MDSLAGRVAFLVAPRFSVFLTCVVVLWMFFVFIFCVLCSEYRGMDTAQCMLFALGVAITVTGVITLGGREQAHSSTHQSLPTEEDEAEESPDGGEHVRQDGSINPADDKYAHSQAGRPHSARHGSKGDAAHHGHAHILPVTEDNLELDLDLDGDLLDESLHHHEPSSAGGLAGSTNPAHVSTQGSTNNDEASVADGAKTVVIEASQRISQAFSRLRGKGGDPHFPVSHSHVASSSPYASSRGSDSLHIPAASNHAVVRTRADSTHHDDSADMSAAEEDHVADHAADPLIQALKGSSSSSSSSSTSRKSPASGHGTNAQQHQSALDAHVSQPPLLRERTLSTTPTAQALYDPTPSPHASSVARTFHAATAPAVPDYTVGAQGRSPKTA